MDTFESRRGAADKTEGGGFGAAVRILDDGAATVDMSVRAGRVTLVFISQGRRSVVSCVSEQLSTVLAKIGGQPYRGGWTTDQLKAACAQNWKAAGGE